MTLRLIKLYGCSRAGPLDTPLLALMRAHAGADQGKELMPVKVVSPYLEMPLRTLQQVEAERQRRAAKLAGTAPAPEPNPSAVGKPKHPNATSASTPPKITA